MDVNRKLPACVLAPGHLSRENMSVLVSRAIGSMKLSESAKFSVNVNIALSKYAPSSEKHETAVRNANSMITGNTNV